MRECLQNRLVSFSHLEWKRVPGRVNFKRSKMVVVDLDSDRGQHGVEVI